MKEDHVRKADSPLFEFSVTKVDETESIDPWVGANYVWMILAILGTMWKLWDFEDKVSEN